MIPGASNSESPSSKRVKTLRRTGGGTSRPRGGALPFAATGEPVLVTVILPPSIFRGVRRGTGNGDVRVPPHAQHTLSVGSPSSTPVVAGCEWVRDDVLKYKSCLTR